MSILPTRRGPRGRSLAILAAAAVMAVGVSGCEEAQPEPQGEETGALMPDTSQPVATPPDAAITGVVPKEGPVPVQENPPAATPGSAYKPDVPVDLPDTERR